MRVKFTSLVLTSVLFASLILTSCAPKAVPVPAPTPAAPAAPVAPAITAEEAAWAKVVEAAKKEGRVTLYTFTFTGDLGRAVARAFEDRHGIKVEFVTGVGAVLIERIRSEQAARRYVADTIDTAPVLVTIAKRAGITERFGQLPAIGEKGVWWADPAMDPEGHLLGMDTVLYTPYINTDMVKPAEEPRSYQDFLQAPWKGKMVVADPSTVPFMPLLYASMVPLKLLDDDYFRRLSKQDIKVAPTVRDNDAMLARGELPVAVVSASLTTNPFIKEGAPIKPVEVREGAMHATSPAIALIKNAPHPNAARLFMNWLLSREGQAVYSQARGTASLRRDVPDSTPPRGKLSPQKVVPITIAIHEEAARLQREKVITKLLGLQ